MAEGLPYNGWPALIRHGRDPNYYRAQRKGTLPGAKNCSGCQAPFASPTIPYHSEEYGPTLEDYWASCAALCHRCHAMVHARFITPNLWKLYLSQVVAADIDARLFPPGKVIAALLSKFKSREDVDYVPMPVELPNYLGTLSMTEYSGSDKVATLLVQDAMSGEVLEVPDWTLYGINLELLYESGRRQLRQRGVRVDDFLEGRISLPVNKRGEPKYVRLYESKI